MNYLMANNHKLSMTIVVLLISIIILVFYFITGFFYSNAFIDFHVLERIYLYFNLVIILLYLLLVSQKTISNSFKFLLFSLLSLALVVFTPFIKYDFLLYGGWDSIGHYSFIKWIINTGSIPQRGEVFYSDAYGFHPGNGLTITFIFFITGFKEVFHAMTFIVYMDYLAYILLFFLWMEMIWEGGLKEKKCL